MFSMAICYSSILLLRTAYLSEPEEAQSSEGKEQSRRSIREVLAKTLAHFQRFRDGWGSLETYPPLALDWLYRVAVAHVFLGSEAGEKEEWSEMDELKVALGFIGQRWKAACEYCFLDHDG